MIKSEINYSLTQPETTQCLFQNHKIIKLEINERKIAGKYPQYLEI